VTEAPAGSVDPPGQEHLGPIVDRFDQIADEILEQVRDHPAAMLVFRTASNLGDFSLIWHLIGVTRAIVFRRADQAIVLGVLLGLESLLVNQGVKRLFRRQRPTSSGDERHPVRTPSTSSFPSGHASSAAFASTILAKWDGQPLGTLWYSIAAVVGLSRPYVRIHHASDVVGGAIVGRILGLIAWRLIARRFRRSVR
jgi:undecaprenyl-diphosphatase